MGAVLTGNQLTYYVKLVGSNATVLLPAQKVNSQAPGKVIEFYQTRILFNGNTSAQSQTNTSTDVMSTPVWQNTQSKSKSPGDRVQQQKDLEEVSGMIKSLAQTQTSSGPSHSRTSPVTALPSIHTVNTTQSNPPSTLLPNPQFPHHMLPPMPPQAAALPHHQLGNTAFSTTFPALPPPWIRSYNYSAFPLFGGFPGLHRNNPVVQEMWRVINNLNLQQQARVVKTCMQNNDALTLGILWQVLDGAPELMLNVLGSLSLLPK